MVKIYMRPADLQINRYGHPGAAEAGQDIVCSAVSILLQTLEIYFKKMNEQGSLRELIDDVRPAAACIKAIPAHYDDSIEASYAFDVISGGLKALAEDYPEYITLEEA